MTKPSVVPPEDVVFEEGTKAVVPTPSADVVQSSGRTWYANNLDFLTSQIAENFVEVDPLCGQKLIFQTGISPKNWALPIGISLCYNSTTLPQYLKINRSLHIKESLSRYLEEKHGKEIFEAIGIAQEFNLGMLPPKDIAEKYFSEFEIFKKIDNTYIPHRNNPYLHLLLLPVKTRAFFAGAMREAFPSLTIDNSTIVTLQKILTTDHIIAYAQKIDETRKIKDYLQVYNQMAGGNVL